MKFDIVFSNPPYNKNIDLKILRSIFSLSKNIVFIHPSRFLIDKKFIKKLYNDVRNSNFLEKGILFWGNDLFKIGLFCPLVISCWNNEKCDDMCLINDIAFSKEKYICKINEVSIYGLNFERVKKIKNFIEDNYKDNFKKHIKNSYELTDFSVKFAAIRGHVGNNSNNNDFYSLICKDFEKFNYINSKFKYKNDKDNAKWRLTFSFNSENERINFINYCKTKIVRFLLSFYKKGSNLNTGEVFKLPWLDFTQHWDDKKLCKEFEIDDDLWNYIDNFIPNYYEDYEYEN